MPNQIPTSGQLVSDYLSSLGSSSYVPFKIPPKAVGSQVGTNVDRDASSQDFLSWLGDILSRPEFAVTETAQSIMDTMDKKQNISPLDAVGHVLSAPFRGFFSTASADKPMGADLITQATNLYNQDNPNYKPGTATPAQNIFKGVTGFGLDILLDPLTYGTLGIVPGLKAISKSLKGTEAVAQSTKAAQEASALKTLADQGIVRNGKVMVKPDQGFTGSLLDSYQGTSEALTPKYSLTIFDDKGLTHKGFNYGTFSGQFATTDEALKAVQEIQNARGGNWIEDIGKTATDGRIKQSDLPTGSTTYSINPLISVGGKVSKASEPIKFTKTAASAAKIGETAAQNKSALRELISTAAKPEGVASTRTSQKVINDILNGRKAVEEVASTTPVKFEDFANKTIQMISESGYKIHRTKAGGLGKVQEDFAKALSVLSPTNKQTLQNLEAELLRIRDKFPNVSYEEFNKMVKANALNKLTIKGAKNAEVIRGDLAAYNKTLKAISQIPGIGQKYISRRELLADAYKEYLNKFAEGTPVNLLGQEVKADGVLNPIDTFKSLIVQDSELLKSIFGNDAFNMLNRMSNPVKFEEAMKAIREIFYKNGVLDDALVRTSLGSSGDAKFKAQQAVLKHIGVDYSTFRGRIIASKNALATNSPLGVTEAVQNAAAKTVVGDMREAGAIYGINNVEDFSTIVNDIVPGAISKVLQENFDVKTINDLYEYITKHGILRTEEELGKGIGLDPVRMNTYKLWNLEKAINSQVDEMLKPLKLGGFELASLKMKYTNAALSIAEDSLRKIGVPLHIDFDGKRYAVGLSDIIESISNTGNKYNIVRKSAVRKTESVSAKGYFAKAHLEALLFNPETSMAPTKLMDAVAYAISNKSLPTEELAKNIRAILQSTESRAGEIGRVENKLAGKGVLGRYRHMFNAEVSNGVEMLKGTKVGEASSKGKGHYVEWSKTETSKNMAKLIIEAIPELEARAVKNSEEFKQLADADSFVIESNGLQNIQNLIENPKGIVELIHIAKKPSEYAADMGSRMAASSVAVADSALKFESIIGTRGTTAAMDSFGRAEALRRTLSEISNMRTGLGMGKKFDAEMARRLPAENKKAYEHAIADAKQVDDIMRQKYERGELTPDDAAAMKEYDVSDSTKAYQNDVEKRIKIGIVRSMYGGLARFFQNDYMLKNHEVNMWRILLESGRAHSELLHTMIDPLKAMQLKFNKLIDGTETSPIVKAFEDLQNGVVPTNPDVLAAYEELSNQIAKILGIGGKGADSILGNDLFRKGTHLAAINESLKRYDVLGLGEYSKYTDDLFDFELAAKTAKEKGTNIYDELANQWRDWEVKDPIQFFSRMNAASIHLATDVSVVNSFVREGLQKGFVSSVPVSGWVKLTASKNNRYVKLLDDVAGHPVYVAPEAAQIFHRMEELGRTTKGLESKVGKNIQNYLDPAQNAWKGAITIYRPGHHFRNIIGTLSMIFLAEGGKFWNRSTLDALKIMSTKSSYTDVDMIRSLQNLGVTKLPKTGEVISKGKYGTFTIDDIYEIAFSKGLLPNVKAIEGLYDVENAAGKFADWVKKASFQESKFGKFAGGVSEYIDHSGRLKHFMQILHKEQDAKVKRFKSVDDLLEYATDRVTKFNPSSDLLTGAERKYAHRVVPFYNWTRGALPAVIAASVMNPGRAVMLNKASYNLAIAMGTDPNSLYDPFPEDQMFPSFLTEKISGPQMKIDGQYYGISPGFVTWDISNMLAPGLPSGAVNRNPSDVISPVMGMVSPFMRVPLDILTGTQLSIGSRINDYSDYIDAQIPMISNIAQISGYSPTGSVLSALQGLGADPTFQANAGNRNTSDQLASAINFLTGIGLTRYSKDNYVNLAEIEKRNREAAKVSTRSAF